MFAAFRYAGGRDFAKKLLAGVGADGKAVARREPQRNAFAVAERDEAALVQPLSVADDKMDTVCAALDENVPVRTAPEDKPVALLRFRERLVEREIPQSPDAKRVPLRLDAALLLRCRDTTLDKMRVVVHELSVLPLRAARKRLAPERDAPVGSYRTLPEKDGIEATVASLYYV